MVRWVSGAIFASMLAFAFPTAAHADEEEQPEPEMSEATIAALKKHRPWLAVMRTADKPRIDGKLDDPAWRAARPSSAFTQKFPDEGKAPTERTTIRVLFDDTALYVGIECEQKNSEIVARMTRRDREIESDRVTVAIASRNDQRSAFEFSVNAAGTVADAALYDDIERSTTWDETWTAVVTRSDVGWTAELAIPLQALRFDPESSSSWGFQVRRYVSARGETDEWAFTPRAAGGEVSWYGSITGLTVAPPGGVQFRPYVLAGLRRLGDDPDFARRGVAGQIGAGADLKWNITSSATLDATLNPDFAQVEADKVTLNLTRYELELPEKRPFFYEGIETFATPLNLVYTRRIGRVPSLPALRTANGYEEVYYDRPTPAPVYGAAKVVADLGAGWSASSLAAVTGPGTVSVSGLMSSGDRIADPLTTHGAVRVKKDFDGLRIGVMGLATMRFEPRGAMPSKTTRFLLGSPYPLVPEGAGTRLCPHGGTVRLEERCFHDAYVGSVDGLWRSESGDYSVGGQAIGTAAVNGPARRLADGTILQHGDVGPGGYLKAQKDGGGRVLTSLELTAIGKKVEYNDLGFMRRQNLARANASIEYRTLEPIGFTRETHTVLGGNYESNWDGLPLGRAISAGHELYFPNMWRAAIDVDLDAARYDDREVGDGTALERASRVAVEEELETDRRQAVVAQLDLNQAARPNGYDLSADASVAFHPLRALELELLAGATHTKGEPRFAALSDAPTVTPIYGRLEASSVSTTVRVTYAISPQLSLQGYTQLFYAEGRYSDFATSAAFGRGARVDLNSLTPSAPPRVGSDFDQAAINVNLLLRWEYAPGSSLYLVYTRAQAPYARLQSTGAPASEAVFLKLSYLFR